MATIRKRGNRWEAQVRRLGRQSITRSFHRRAEAQAWALQTEIRLEQADLGRDLKALSEVTAGALIDRYIDEIVIRKRAAPVETVILRALQRQAFAAKALALLTPGDVAEYRDRRLGRVKPATINRELGLC